MASPAKSPKPTGPAEELPSFDNDPDIDMVNEEGGAAAEGEGEAAGTDATNAEGTADVRERDARIASIENAIQNQQSLPVRKDISLREFLNRMDDCAPIIPDAVTAHALTLAGLPPPPLGKGEAQDAQTTPQHLSRLLALATQKFVADIAADAYQYSRMRSGNLTSNSLSAMSNPGAAMMGAGVGGQGEGGGGGGGGKAADKGKQSGQHVLGAQRPGYGGGGQGGGSNRTVLTMEDLGMAVGEYGVNVKRGEFYR